MSGGSRNQSSRGGRSALLAIGLGAATIGCLAAVSRRRIAALTGGNTAAPIQGMWTTVDGLRIHVRVAGNTNDPPVILVHGLGVSSRYFAPSQTRLANEFRVYAPDLPGFGKSDSPPHVLDVPELAAALAGWMRENDLTRAALIGNSMGCQVIAHLATRRPDLVERAVLSGPTMDPYARHPVLQLFRLLLVAPREQPGMIMLALRDYVQSGLARTLRTYRHALRDQIDMQLPRMTMPVMVVRGGRDSIVSQRWVEEASKLLPHGCLRVLPTSAHAAHFSTPDEFTRAIRPFLLACPD